MGYLEKHRRRQDGFCVQEVMVEPAALGLDLICRGLSQISQDDFEAMERGSLIYDALYAQLKLDAPK